MFQRLLPTSTILLKKRPTVMLLKMRCESGRASTSKVLLGGSGSTAAKRMVQKKPSRAVTCRSADGTTFAGGMCLSLAACRIYFALRKMCAIVRCAGQQSGWRIH